MVPLNLFQSAILIPILVILAGIIIPISVFIWLYFDSKNKQKTILEISKNLNDPSKVEEWLKIFEERKKEPIDFRRNGFITLFTVGGFCFFGVFFLGSIMKAVGVLISLIGLSTVIAGYLHPYTLKELTDTVDEFEKM